MAAILQSRKLQKEFDSPHLFRISWNIFGKAVLSLPLIGFITCVIWSVMFQFERTTATHCGVRNYLPSTSAAIAERPQKYIWRICIALHICPRLMIAMAYYNYHMSLAPSSNPIYRILCFAVSLLHSIENISLLFLSCISSKEEHDVHENCFILFMVSSMSYMVITCILFQWRQIYRPTPEEKYSLVFKKKTMFVNIASFFTSVIFYFRHNSHCEPGIYTLFAFFEYLTIFSNIAFHSSAVMDFNGPSEAQLTIIRNIQKEK